MKIIDLLSLSFENLRRRFGRTALTIIGVVVGTCSILVMMSLGIAMDKNFSAMLEQWGDLTVIQVYNWSGQNSDVPKLDDEMVAKLGQLEHVSIATPQYSPQYLQGGIVVQTKSGRYKIEWSQITAMYADAIKALDIELVGGNYLAANEKKDTVAVLAGEFIGYQFTDTKKRGENAYRYQGMTDANGNELPPFVDAMKDDLQLVLTKSSDEGKTLTYMLDVCGIMKQDNKKGYFTYGGLLMDLNTVKQMEKEYMRANGIKENKNQGYDNVYIKVDDVDNVEAVDKAIKEYGYDTYSMSSERENMQQQSRLIQMVLGGLGAVSLFVAALSIANTMTMAIYERTREIGVMKVLGCGLGKIREMFLLEAAMIGFIGGVLGVVFSYALSLLLNFFGPALAGVLGNLMGGMGMAGSTISIIPPWLALTGVVFATVIGVLSGIMPANRAVKISALEAIRHE